MLNEIYMRPILAVLAMLFTIFACSPNTANWSLQSELEALQRQHPSVPGFAIAIIHQANQEVAATGQADPEGTPMRATTPVRIASITKTFVAAAVLRLWEQGRLDLDTSIDALISTEINELLQSDGYHTQDIKVRHLLLHASGMADHVGDEYVQQVFSNPKRVWTPAQQIEVLIQTTDPLSKPGTQFSYSDTGYVVLGEVVSRVTQSPLNAAVRELLKLEQLNLTSLHWDEIEQPAAEVADRAHQWIDGADIFSIHGSMDGHGGGGLVASVLDVAAFYQALFTGKVFSNASTLETMMSAPGHPADSPYRYGLFNFEVAGQTAFHHGGFWGTYVTHVPSMGLTIAGVALDQSGYEDLRGLMFRTVKEYGAHQIDN